MTGKMSMRLVGVDLLPHQGDWSTAGDAVANARDLLSGRPPSRSTNSSSMATAPVFAAPSGDRYTTLPSVNGQVAMPWISGSPLNLEEGNPSTGGFIAIDKVDWSARPMGLRGGPSKIDLIRSVLAMMAEAGVPLPSPQPRAQRRPPGRQPSDYVTAKPLSGTPAPAEHSPENADETSTAEQPSVIDQVKDKLPDILLAQAVGTLATAFEDGTLTEPLSLGGNFGAGVLGGVASAAAIAYAMSALGGKPPDATSSTMDWARATVVPLLAGKMLTMGNFSKFIGGGPDKPAPIRVDDIDDIGNPVLEGMATVLIENKAASRVGDQVKPPGIALDFGAKTVKIGGKYSARRDDTVSKAAPFTEAMCVAGRAVKTQIGGPTTNPQPPIPSELKEWADKWSKKNGKEVEDAGFRTAPKNPSQMPSSPGYWFDEIKGEWRIWDGDAWSMTLSEYEALPDWGNFGLSDVAGWFGFDDTAKWLDENFALRNLFGGAKDNPEDWTLLGGLIDLGSPMFPGAGNSASWFTPDALFGMDMRSLSEWHDWMFDPGNPATGNAAGLLSILNVELTSWLQLANDDPRWNSWNPIHWVLQSIYSLATTSAAIAAWWERWMENLQLEAGLPDRYGEYAR